MASLCCSDCSLQPGDAGFAQVVTRLVCTWVGCKCSHALLASLMIESEFCCRCSLNVALLGPGWSLHCNCYFVGFESACRQRQVTACWDGVLIAFIHFTPLQLGLWYVCTVGPRHMFGLVHCFRGLCHRHNYIQMRRHSVCNDYERCVTRYLPHMPQISVNLSARWLWITLRLY